MKRTQDDGTRLRCTGCRKLTINPRSRALHCGGTCADKENSSRPRCHEMKAGKLVVVPASQFKWRSGCPF